MELTNNQFIEGLHYYPFTNEFTFNLIDSPTQMRTIRVDFKTVEDLVRKYLTEKGEIKNGKE